MRSGVELGFVDRSRFIIQSTTNALATAKALCSGRYVRPQTLERTLDECVRGPHYRIELLRGLRGQGLLRPPAAIERLHQPLPNHAVHVVLLAQIRARQHGSARRHDTSLVVRDV